MNVSDTQYAVVKFVGKKIFRWKLQYDPEGTNWDMFWTDCAVSPETLGKMQRTTAIHASLLKDQPFPWHVLPGPKKSPRS